MHGSRGQTLRVDGEGDELELVHLTLGELGAVDEVAALAGRYGLARLPLVLGEREARHQVIQVATCMQLVRAARWRRRHRRADIPGVAAAVTEAIVAELAIVQLKVLDGERRALGRRRLRPRDAQAVFCLVDLHVLGRRWQFGYTHIY